MSREIGYEREIEALVLTGRIGFATAELIADWIWRSRHGRKLAEALLRRLVAAGKLLRRPIPGRAAAYVLTVKGASEVGDEASGIRAGTGWGQSVRGQPWHPPKDYQHDLRAARFLVMAAGRGFEVAFDREIRRLNQAMKYPDGLIWRREDDRLIARFIEVEQARKNGSDVRQQAEAIVQRTRMPEAWIADPITRITPTRTLVVLPPDGHKDRRGYKVDHQGTLRGSLERALARNGEQEVAIEWAKELADGNFSSPELERIRAAPGHPDA